MLAITALHRFLSLILSPTPFADLFVAPLLVFVTPLTASTLVPAIAVAEAPAVADCAETVHLFVPSHLNQSQGPAAEVAEGPKTSDTTISALGEDPQDFLSVSVSDEEEDDSWELSCSEDGDSSSAPSSVTSNDLAEELKAFFTFHTNVSIENIQLYPDEDDRTNSGNDCKSHEDDSPAVPVCTPPSAFVASAIPRRVYVALGEEQAYTSDPEPLQIAPESIDDIDEIENYNVQWLTPRALGEAKSRSRKIQRTARMRALDLAKAIPLKAHEHPEPRSRRGPSVLKDLGHSSSLHKSFGVEDLEEDSRQQAILERSWAEEEEDILPDLQDLQCFFKKRT